jgi:hypothetical protein
VLLRIKQRHRIATEQEIGNYENDAAKSAAHGKAPTAGPANIFNIFTFSSSLPQHLFNIAWRGSLAFMTYERPVTRDNVTRRRKVDS